MFKKSTLFPPETRSMSDAAVSPITQLESYVKSKVKVGSNERCMLHVKGKLSRNALRVLPEWVNRVRSGPQCIRSHYCSNVLCVTVVEGVNLMSADPNGYSDPYIKFKVNLSRTIAINLCCAECPPDTPLIRTFLVSHPCRWTARRRRRRRPIS